MRWFPYLGMLQGSICAAWGFIELFEEGALSLDIAMIVAGVLLFLIGYTVLEKDSERR